MAFRSTLTSINAFLCFCITMFSIVKCYDECGNWKYVDHVNLEVDMLVTGGHDIGGHLLLVCRALRAPKILLPGKSRPELGRCYTSYNGGEKYTDQFEVLVEDTPKSFKWAPYTGVIPENAVLGGKEHIAPLYIGRCTLRGKRKDNTTYLTDLVGKIHYSPLDPKFVYIPFGGLEFKCRENLKILVCTDPDQTTQEIQEEVATIVDPRTLKSKKNSTTTKNKKP